MPEHAAEYETADIVNIRNLLALRYEPLGALSIFYMIFHHALLLRDVRPGLVHAWQDFSNVLAGVAADLVGVPRLVLSGRSVAPDNFALFQPYMAPAYHAMFDRRGAVFLNNSEAGANDYARWLALPRDRFRVVHNGFDFPGIPHSAGAAVRKRFELSGDAIIVGSIIRFGEEKRPELMIDMAVVLHRLYPQVRFLIFGDGPLLELCRTFVVQNGLEDVIKLPGVATDAWAALSAMDVFVLTSRLEGLPNVLIEAQAMGLPVVCTGAGGMCETFVEGETGFAVRSATAEDLAKAVARLIADSRMRQRMGDKARRHALDRFGMERMIDQTLDAYRSAPEYVSDAEEPAITVEPSPASDILITGARKEQGKCFAANLAAEHDYSMLALWEDDRLIGARAALQDVRDQGAGRFCIESGRIFFSSSDGSDIRFNGRTYHLQAPDAAHDIEQLVVSPEMITPEIGYCYIAAIGNAAGAARYGLWEDDSRLGPGGCLHDDVRLHGGGRYSVWGETLYFSSSDNTDPRSNQRTYILRRGKPMLVAGAERNILVGLSLEQAMHHLVKSAVPRRDFVRGRVVHVGGSLGPGGAERQILYTLSGLRQRPPIESVQLLCYYLGSTATDRHDFYLSAFQAAEVPVRTIRRQVGWGAFESMPPPLRDVAEALPPQLAADIADLYWEFIELKPQVVHAWLDGNNERAGLAAALAGVPNIIVSGRNMNPTHFPFYEPYMANAYRSLLELPQVTMLNNSQAGRDDYAEWLGIPPSRIRVLYNGVDLGEQSRPPADQAAEIRRKLGLREDAFVVGGVFRFAAEKRPILWIETAKQIAERLPNAQFILFGHGELRSEMETAVQRLDLASRLIFAGVTNDILQAISTMDVLLLTSRVEGVPNVVLEAQWMGVPVVATEAGGTAEALEQGVSGWMVDPPAAGGLAERIIWLNENPQARAAVETRGPAFVRQRFGLESMLDQTLKVYRM